MSVRQRIKRLAKAMRTKGKSEKEILEAKTRILKGISKAESLGTKEEK